MRGDERRGVEGLVGLELGATEAWQRLGVAAASFVVHVEVDLHKLQGEAVAFGWLIISDWFQNGLRR